ncbi:MAG: putative DNA-binding domain-containing protein [Methylococcales bacterium]|nr:putative DNA-binding domain-containing protein [Methylococcales bacterium]
MTDCLPSRQGVDFKATQLAFAAYIKDPFNNPAPADVKPQRMNIYRELFFNNVSGFLSSNFPVLNKILTEAQWLELAQDFFANHRSESPYFSEIPEEFLAYLQDERNNPNDYPFMLELAHYEWVEMALSIATDSLPALVECDHDNLLHQSLRLSPLAWSLAYQYPVQKISPDFLPLEPPAQATYLIVYRDWEDDVHFIQTTPVTFRLLQLLDEDSTLLVDACLQKIGLEMNLTNIDSLVNNGLETLKSLIRKGILFIEK